ncbi:hypothetical protein F4802DRAFT_566820 [Xylaria palmicola]|nr:hypothetical protein F4802DRAFT_566820 [Xylaria palmicola]
MDELSEMPEHYYTHDGRLSSFQPPQPAARRGSNAKGKAAKALAWPHKRLDPDTLARAGFYFAPTPDKPDNTVCFLCCHKVCGWEEDDNPFEEHLRLAPDCGWAILACIEIGMGDYALDDPTGSKMIAARKETFGDRWPHDGKRGWKCKTKQLVDAGWKYTPTMESDDMATCTYCQLALDGWEPKDNPMDEHYRRSPDCPFFTLINQYKAAAPAKKKGRGKTARSSKAVRLSIQSVATTASDVTSLLEHPADHDDSIVTTTSIMTQGGTKRPRAKKATTAKGKKSRAKKVEVQVLEDPEEIQPETQEESVQMETEEIPPKPTRGRKRTSTAIGDLALGTTEAPAPKKRATRGRVVSAKAELSDTTHAMFDPVPQEIDDAVINAELKALEAEMEVEPAKTLNVPKKGRQAGTRKVSKQTTKKTKKKAPIEPTPEPEHTVDQDMDELAEGQDVSIVSNATIVRTSISSTAAPRKRGRPSKASIAARAELQAEPAAQPNSEQEIGPEKASLTKPQPVSEPEVEPEPEIESEPAPEPEPEPEPEHELQSDSEFEPEPQSEPHPEPTKTVSPKAAVPKAAKKSPPSRDKSLPPLPPDSDHIQPPSTPKAMISPAPAAKQAAVSPSQSPQSSDAENQPPSSKPSNTSNSTRVALAPVPATPAQSSPSKRNIISGLQSTQPWEATDIERIFDDLDQENVLSTGHFLRSGTDLTTPEKQMTVEEWIHYNAEQAEKQLKHECEAIVMAFEREGTRAMQALEGIVVE